jgi:transglutaminase-like putative cysteine protease
LTENPIHLHFPRRILMNRRRFAAGLLLLLTSVSLFAQAPRTRSFTFTYQFTVRNPQQGKQLRVWFPLAVSDKHQQVKVVSVKGDLPLKRIKDAKYGNHVFYAQTPVANKPEYSFEAVYEITRTERLALGRPYATPELRPANLRRFTQPDRLVPTSGRLAELAREQARGISKPLDKARALYNYVFQNMSYDKTGTGWGRGDAEWACDSKKGNCTDFHSLFASMARSQGIPTRFEIGFSIPSDKQQGEIAGYHCWSDFWVDRLGWVPIDISEAWKHPEKRNYFFGAHDENRVQFSIGRDIVLSPKQNGAPLNYFVYPYVESDGKELSNVRYAFSFRDLSRL